MVALARLHIGLAREAGFRGSVVSLVLEAAGRKP
jgi:hypothetical protein